jgi:hypothetical protein
MQQKVHAFVAGNSGLRKVKLPLIFFFQQEQVQASQRLFTGIRNAKGTIVRSISAILQVLLHFLCATFYCLHFIILGSVIFCQSWKSFFSFFYILPECHIHVEALAAIHAAKSAKNPPPHHDYG